MKAKDYKGIEDYMKKKKEKPYNWEPTLRKLDKDQVGNSDIYITYKSG